MENPSKIQICPSLFLSKTSLLCIVGLLLPSLVFTCFPGSGFSPFIVTFPILILSTAFLIIFTKNKKREVEKPVQDENLDPIRNLLEHELEEKLLPVTENFATRKAAQQSEVGSIHKPEDFPSDSESSDDSISSENFELNWMHCNSAGSQNGVTFSDSVSEDDEDGLIEIAIPGSDSNDGSKEPKQKVESNLPESILSQQGLTEVLADINEVNEEENLIEIDISMGSIKCSRFEIEA